MSMNVMLGIVFFGMSFAAHSAVSVIGPDGRVELFYQEGNKVMAKECEDYGLLDTVEDCQSVPGKRIRQYESVADFKEILRTGLRVDVKGWDEDMKKSIVSYNDKWKKEDIQRLLNQEADLMKEIATREDFAQQYGPGAIDAEELKGMKDELARVQKQLSAPNQSGKRPIREIESKIDRLMSLIAGSDDNIHYYVFPNDEGSFVANILRRFWEVGAVSNFQAIPVGKFMMGSPSDEEGRLNDEEGASGEQVQVHITRAFEMMAMEVTQGQWFEIMKNNPSRYNQEEHCDNHQVVDGIHLCPDNPVEGVSWSDIQNFATKLNQKEKLVGCDGSPNSGKGCYRLPTEAEWEYAARGGTKTAYSFGDMAEDLVDYGWYGANSDRQTHEVGQLKANPFGLYDMHGNVWEWVQDGYVEKLPGGNNPFQPPVADGVFHVVRGGSWFHLAQDLRSAFRKGVYPNNRYNNIGFRLVRTR